MHSLALAGVYQPFDGLGGMSVRLADGLDARGVRVHRIPRDKYGRVSHRVLIALDSVLPMLHRLSGAPITIPYAMYESDALPPGWVDALNRAQHIIVPTTFCKDVFEAEGVRVPITVIPGGVDPAYRFTERPERAGLTTVIVGTLIPRKNWEIGVEAWQQVAGPQDRLILKAGHHLRDYRPSDPRITLESGPSYHAADVSQWYRNADILLALGSEGYGLPLIEGMASGLACIALDAAGQADIVREGGPVVSVPAAGWRDHQCESWGQIGRVPYPSVDDVAGALSGLMADRTRLRTLGREASAWALTHRDNGQMAGRALDVVREVDSQHPPRWRPSTPVRSIMIERGAGIGDSLLMVPALRALRSAGARISYRGPHEGAAWLKHVGLIDEGIAGSDSRPQTDMLIGFSHEPQRWRRENHRSGARTVISAPTIGEAGTHQALHQYQQIARAVPVWNAFNDSPVHFPVRESIRERYRDAVVLAAGTSTPAKVWPHFRQLAQRLQLAGHRVVFLEPCPQAEGFETFRGGFVPASEVIASCRLLIGNDSCAVHCAGLVGTPSIALYGPTLPAHWQPIGIGSTVLHGCPRLKGRGDTNAVLACIDHDCWGLLPLETVVAHVELELSGRRVDLRPPPPLRLQPGVEAPRASG